MTQEEKYTLGDFIREYKCYSPDYETYIGLEFDYKNHSYRISREPNDNERFYLLKVTMIDSKGSYYVYNLNFEILGIFNTIEELLECSLIDSKPLKDVLFSDYSTITGQD